MARIDTVTDTPTYLVATRRFHADVLHPFFWNRATRFYIDNYLGDHTSYRIYCAMLRQP